MVYQKCCVYVGASLSWPIYTWACNGPVVADARWNVISDIWKPGVPVGFVGLLLGENNCAGGCDDSDGDGGNRHSTIIR